MIYSINNKVKNDSMRKKAFLFIAFLLAIAQGAWAQTEVKTETELRAVIDVTGSNKSVKMTADIQLGSHLANHVQKRCEETL